jgi:hypothetical protein
VRSGSLKTTVLAAVAGAIWTQVPQASLRLRRLSLKCWLIGHDDWIRRTPDRLYLECLECGRETQGWLTKNQPVDQAGGAVAGAAARQQERDSAFAMGGSTPSSIAANCDSWRNRRGCPMLCPVNPSVSIRRH